MVREPAVGTIIVGHHRSGTSLLRNLVDSHPAISITNEFGCYQVLDQPFGSYAKYILKRWLDRRNNPFFHPPDAYKRKVPGSDFLRNSWLVFRFLSCEGLRRSPRAGTQEITAGLGHLFSEQRIVGDKFPDYWFILDRLVKRELKILAIYRDPRDMVSSVVEKARGPWKAFWPAELEDASSVAARWVAVMERFERNRDDIHLICYEELVTEPKRTMEKVGAYLGADPEAFILSGVRADSIGKHELGLERSEIKAIVDVAGEIMLRFNYRP